MLSLRNAALIAAWTVCLTAGIGTMLRFELTPGPACGTRQMARHDQHHARLFPTNAGRVSASTLPLLAGDAR